MKIRFFPNFLYNALKFLKKLEFAIWWKTLFLPIEMIAKLGQSRFFLKKMIAKFLGHIFFWSSFDPVRLTPRLPFTLHITQILICESLNKLFYIKLIRV